MLCRIIIILNSTEATQRLILHEGISHLEILLGSRGIYLLGIALRSI